MTEEQIKTKAKEQFPNDEFAQQIIIDAINWATKELEKENAELKEEIQKIIELLLENGNLFFEDYEGKVSPITYCDIKDDKIIFME